MELFISILYWGALISWSAVITYIILVVFFPEKVRHEPLLHDPDAPTFARHRFQKLPGSDAITVNDIVTALSHSQPSPEVSEEEHEIPVLDSIDTTETSNEVSEEEHEEESR